MPPRLIRRRHLFARIKAYLNPFDFFLWLAEELDTSDWDQWQRAWATPVGITLNIVFLIARANFGSSKRGGDDVFGDTIQYTGWLSWLVGIHYLLPTFEADVWQAAFLTHFLTLLSLTNAAYMFWRKRHYRLFENALDAPPSTPSAYRVRVSSSPISSSPFRFLSSMLAGETAESRSYSDTTRDVWELAVWDPTPLSLEMFCYLSPGHVLIYWLFLPTAPEDPRPSVSVLTTAMLTALLSVQLITIQFCFSQQSKDTSVIHKEVLNEYDTKFVHPRTRPIMRDVGTQLSNPEPSKDDLPRQKEPAESVDTYTPAIIANRGFHTRPNPNYAKHVDPEGLTQRATPSRSILSSTAPPYHTPAYQRDASSPLRPNTAIRQRQFLGVRNGDGGSLGVYAHAQSPLRKAASTNFADTQRQLERSSSPLKKISVADGPHGHRLEYTQGPSASRGSGKY
ncbi:hypothetical protein MMC07_009449 [Pseudocyphellaria aurata]|nr:hypothetical protein [Pseudocyphellaria aurata]